MTSIVIDIFEYSPGKYAIIKSTKNKTKPYLDEPTTKNGYCQVKVLNEKFDQLGSCKIILNPK